MKYRVIISPIPHNTDLALLELKTLSLPFIVSLSIALHGMANLHPMEHPPMLLGSVKP
jgi:hypothetical protein